MNRKRELASDVSTNSLLEAKLVNSLSTPEHNGLHHLRVRLERLQIENSQGKAVKQTSPTLEKLKMTPGRVLKDREVLTSKHLSARQKSDKLNIGGGVCLWPGMEDMRLSRWEMLELVLMAILLLLSVLFCFYKLHGSTIEELFQYYVKLKNFNNHHHIVLSKETLNTDLLQWHKDYRQLISHIHKSFDISRVPLLYVMYVLVYSGGMGFLIYCLIDNMLAKSKLSPNRIKQWVCILVVISTWTGSLFYFLISAYIVESAIEMNIVKLTEIFGDALEKDLETSKLAHMINFWQTIPEKGTLTVLGVLTVRDLVHYLQYYCIPIITILVTPVIKLIMSLYSIYHVSG